MGKSLLGSKTFWLNILGAAGLIASSGVIPIKYSAPILGVVGIANRVLFTDSPIETVLPQK